MQPDFTNVFSKATLLSTPKLILSLDDNLTLPTAVLHASFSPNTPFTEFLNLLKQVPLFLVSKDGQRLASTTFSHVTLCVVRGCAHTEIEEIVSTAVPFKGDVMTKLMEEDKVLVKANNKETFTKAVAAIKEKAKKIEEIYFLTEKDVNGVKSEVKDKEEGPVKPKTRLKQYRVKELLKIFSGMNVEREPPRKPKNLGWYEKEALNVVLRMQPIPSLALYGPSSFGNGDYFGRRTSYGKYDRGYNGRRRYMHRGYQYR